jgi:hypothetical protein
MHIYQMIIRAKLGQNHVRCEEFPCRDLFAHSLQGWCARSLKKSSVEPRNKDLRQRLDRKIRTYVDEADFFSDLVCGGCNAFNEQSGTRGGGAAAIL